LKKLKKFYKNGADISENKKEIIDYIQIRENPFQKIKQYIKK